MTPERLRRSVELLDRVIEALHIGDGVWFALSAPDLGQFGPVVDIVIEGEPLRLAPVITSDDLDALDDLAAMLRTEPPTVDPDG